MSSHFSYKAINLELKDNGVWVMTIHRPEALNALNQQVLNEMADALRQIRRRRDGALFRPWRSFTSARSSGSS